MNDAVDNLGDLLKQWYIYDRGPHQYILEIILFRTARYHQLVQQSINLV